MWRWLGGGLACLLAVAGVLLWRQSGAGAGDIIPPVPLAHAGTASAEPLPEAPEASEKTREERRFNRYDKDRDGIVSREEYLASRRKAFAKLDANSDGRLSFEEWAKKTTDKFADADNDGSGGLVAKEFATTAVKRKAITRPDCPRPAAAGEES